MLAADTFIAPNASVIGRVQTLDKTSVWYGAVLRADRNKIKLGFCSNVQDRCVAVCDITILHSTTCVTIHTSSSPPPVRCPGKRTELL